jgi:hypothetical protein
MDFAKLRGHVRQQFYARVGHEHIVFNPDAAPIRKIGARLNRKHHAGCHELVSYIDVRAPSDDPGIFVHIDPEAVAGAMSKRLTHPSLRQAFTSRAVNRKPRLPRSD